MLDKIKFYWGFIQDLLNVDGGLYVDAMCLVMIARLLGPFFHQAPLTNAEAGLWSVTVTAFSGHRIAKILRGAKDDDNS